MRRTLTHVRHTWFVFFYPETQWIGDIFVVLMAEVGGTSSQTELRARIFTLRFCLFLLLDEQHMLVSRWVHEEIVKHTYIVEYGKNK